jgi:hypothetical protein
MLLRTIRRPISLSIKKSVKTVKNIFAFMPVRQTSIPLTREERWWLNLLVVWNVVLVRSPASMVPSNGNIHGADSGFNIDMDNGNPINSGQYG